MRLKDYKGEEAILLMGDIIEPVSIIVKDDEIKSELKGKTLLHAASCIFKKYPKEVNEILLRIDDSPLDGANVLTRLFSALIDITSSPDFQLFFDLSGQMTQSVPIGSHMETTEVKEN